MKINPNKQHAIFAHKMQSSMGLLVGFLNIYCEL